MALIVSNDYKYQREFSAFIRKLYVDYPRMVGDKIEEFAELIDSQNPFDKFGSLKFFTQFDGDKIVAQAVAIVDNRLPNIVGLVGYFEALSLESGRQVIKAVTGYLAVQGKKIFRGPINLTTWQNFRLPINDGHPPFFMEPFGRHYYQQVFFDLGFTVAQKNISTVSKVDRTHFANFKENYRQAIDSGFTLVEVNKENLSVYLPEIYKLSLEIFASTWSFVLLSLEEFMYYYGGLTRLDDNDFFTVILKDKNKKTVGFCFAYHDFYEPDRHRIILKTLGVQPEYQGRNCGGTMLYWLYRKALLRNMSEIIFSTMRADNQAIFNLIGESEVYREYLVFESNDGIKID